MADDVLLTNIKLDGADQVQNDLRRIGEEGSRAFNKLSQAANQRFDQVSAALAQVSQSLDRFANTRVEINTDRANQALENIARVTDTLSRRLDALSSQRVDVDTSKAVRSIGEVGQAAEQSFGQTAKAAREPIVIIDFLTDAVIRYKKELLGLISLGGVGAFFNGLKNAVAGFAGQGSDSLDAKLQSSVRGVENLRSSIEGLGNLKVDVPKQLDDFIKKFDEANQAASQTKGFTPQSPVQGLDDFNVRDVTQKFDQIGNAIDENLSGKIDAFFDKWNSNLGSLPPLPTFDDVASEAAEQQVQSLGSTIRSVVAKSKIEVADLKNVFQLLGESPEKVKAAFEGLAGSLSSFYEKIRAARIQETQSKQQDAHASEAAGQQQIQINQSIAQSVHALEVAERDARRAHADNDNTRKSTANSVRSAELGYAEALNKVREMQGKSLAYTPQRIADARTVLGLRQAEVALSEAKLKRDREEADFAEKRKQSEQQQQNLALQIANARRQQDELAQRNAEAAKKRAEQAANSIPHLQNFVSNLINGVSAAGSKVNATAENLAKGLVAGLGAGAKGIQGFGTSLDDLKKATDIQPALFRIADLFKATGDEALNARIATQLFGTSIDEKMLKALSLGSNALKSIIGLQKDFSVPNLAKFGDELLKIPDAEKRVATATAVLGDTLGKAFTDALGRSGSGTAAAAQFAGVAEKFKENAKVAGDFKEALAGLNVELAKMGVASKQGQLDLGLMLAPFATPIIKQVTEGLKTLKLDIGQLAAQAGDALAPIVKDFFSVLAGKSEQVSTASGEMFAVLASGFKAVGQAAENALKAVNEFFGTKITLADIGIGALLISLTGGFNALAIAVGAVFAGTSPKMEEFKKNLQGVGINVDEIIRKAKVFAVEIPKAIKETFENKDERTARQERDKQEKAALPGGVDEDAGIKKLAREFVSLGEVIVSVGALALTFRRTMIALGVGVGLEKLTGIFSSLSPILTAAAGAVVLLSNSLTLLITLLDWPVVLVAGLVLVVQNLEAAKGAFTLFVNALNAIFGVKFTNLEVLAALLALIAVRTGFVAFVMGLFAPAVTAAATAAGAAATGGFAAFLATMSRVAIAVGIAVLALETFQALSGAIEKSGVKGDSKQTDVAKIVDLNKQIQYEQVRQRKATTEEGKQASQEKIDALRKQLEELRTTSGIIPADAGKKVEDDQKNLMERLFKGWEGYQKKFEDLMGKGLGGASTAPGAPKGASTSKPKQSQEEIDKIRTNIPDDQTAIMGSDGTWRRVRRSTPTQAQQEVGGGGGGIPPAQKAIGGPGDVTVAQMEAEKAKIADLLKDMAANAAKEVEKLLSEAARRTALTATDPGSDTTGKFTGREMSPNAKDLRTLAPEELRQFQEASDLIAKFNRSLETATETLTEMQRQVGVEGIAGSGKLVDQTTVAPAQEALTATTRRLDASEAALNTSLGVLKTSVDSLTTAVDALAATVNALAAAVDALAEAADDLAAGFDQLAIVVDALAEAIDDLAEAVDVVAAAFDDLGESADELGDALDTTAQSASDLTKVLDALMEAAVSATNALGALARLGGDGSQVTKASATSPAGPGQGARTTTSGAAKPGGGTSKTTMALDAFGNPVEVTVTSFPSGRGKGHAPQDGGVPGSSFRPSTDTPSRSGGGATTPPTVFGPDWRSGSPGGVVSPPPVSSKPIPVVPVTPSGQPLATTPAAPPANLGGQTGRRGVDIINEQIERNRQEREEKAEEERQWRLRTVPPDADTPGWTLPPGRRQNQPPAQPLGSLQTDPPQTDPDALRPGEAAEIMEKARSQRERMRLGRSAPRIDIDDALRENQRILEGPPPRGPSQLDQPGKRGIDPQLESDELNFDDFEGAIQRLSSIIAPLGAAFDGLVASATGAATATTALSPALDQTTTALEEVSTSAQQVPQEVQQADQALEQVDLSEATQEVQQFVQDVNQTLSQLSSPKPDGMAGGGLISGPGTDTSDSIPILASANEFMVRAAAVRHYGKDFMHRVNSMSFPRFAMGGLVDVLNTPLSGQIRVPRFADGGPIGGGGSSSPGSVPVHVNFEGKRVFSASASRSSIEQLKRESLMQKVRSGGPSPFWVD